ncbi:cell filamentation protein Fic [Roseivirga seohaensis]|uniref:Cell filamentation protein Fic n=1 Tax=Roseivirga seohaensis TaxID=1914963 RepID=A0A150XWS0_9BACT|nr:cell filamentation protein Fic [Roseivirga seohaensis]
MPKQNNFILYTTNEGEVKLNVLLENETIWLTQEQMSQLFDRERSVITKHIGNVFSEGELEEKSNVQILHISGSDKPVKFYNLDVIISVGYRVKSQRGTQFRIWATQTLKEYIIKGFVMDDERLKQGTNTFGKDYFKELLRRVRSIRASERRIYQQVTDIFAECSIDYDPKSEITKNFYAMVQNKFHFAITGKTAAEIIHLSANAKKENMGLTTWKNSPDGRVLKSDVIIAKNYLQEKEIQQLERTVTGYFDYIEGLIERENTFTMEGLAESVNKFLTFNEYKVLTGKGRITKLQADKKAVSEYDEFNKTQKIISDFDKQVKRMKTKD